MHNLLNEYTDLSQRLEHLVAYSSQMVFISGEHMGNQKDFVEAFLSTRQDDLDVIYITGNNFHTNEDVRSEFARQLLGNAPRLDLSLLQLISTREDKRNPLLIAITRAERLPDQILRELWDLVLQNRFARNQQQINILLFGEQEWAERTKAWLPTNNNDKPVLLTSETVEVQSEQEIEGDLEEYIKAKRKEFNERLKLRALTHEPTKSVWSNWWLRLLAACVFIVCFSGILIWQYFDLTQSAINEFAGFLFQGDVKEQQVEGSNDDWQKAKDLLAETDTLKVETVQPALTQAQDSTKTQSNESGEKLESSTLPADQARVTSWQEASRKLERQSVALNLPEEQAKSGVNSSSVSNPQPEKMPTESGGMELYESESLVQVPKEKLMQLQPQEAITESTIIVNSYDNTQSEKAANEIGPPIPQALQAKNSVPTQSEQDQVAATSVQEAPVAVVTAATSEAITEEDDVVDYQVEDIVSVEELPQSPSNQVVTAEPEPAYQFDETALLALPETSYLLQISGISSRQVLNEYLVDNKLTDKVWIYKTQRYGGDWHVVLYRKNYASLNEARDSVSELPQTSRQSAPFAKSIAMIRDEIQQGYPE
ncbi:hypothetical protein KIH87_18025 [Paraneptunicella aestuarii]|uniref:SPOR domain-containing protein n=1 Tax=Paraneptunicella aestuarii TaxID=2831148 RepID=UPI001E4380B7|nr:hypothetical protein [Paraneptunicella aestuarii]UAA38541.1 hypothetical protein KIH87_18025 [Paraneptunicella aestuarii]